MLSPPPRSASGPFRRHVLDRLWSGRTRRSDRPAATPTVACERLEDRLLLTTVTWDGDAGDGDWHNAVNWDGDVLPGLSDDVRIGVGDTVEHSGAGGGFSTTSINSLEVEGRLEVSGGSIRLTEVSRVAGEALVTGGGLSGVGSLSVTGRVGVTAGSLSVEHTTVEGGAILRLERTSGGFGGSAASYGGEIEVLDGGRFEFHNEGTLGFYSGEAVIRQGGEMVFSGVGVPFFAPSL